MHVYEGTRTKIQSERLAPHGVVSRSCICIAKQSFIFMFHADFGRENLERLMEVYRVKVIPW